MELELEASAGGGGSIVVSLSGESPAADLGRGHLGSAAAPHADRTVSRRHVSLHLLGGGEPRIAFEVVGRNPVVVRSSVGGDKVYRRGEAGELQAGDGLSLSLKAPLFWTVWRSGAEEEAKAEMDASVLDAVARRERKESTTEVTEQEHTAAASSGEFDAETEDLKLDLATIDPVREFGFLSMGHEFDNYPKGRIRPPKDWNWFLEETRSSSDDEDDDVSNKGGKSKNSRGATKKKEKGEGEDEDWTDESADEKDYMPGGPSLKRPKEYITRSKDPKKPRKKNSTGKHESEDDADEEEEEDEEDETLGGFIVNEEDDPMEELDEEEEEELDDEDDND